MLRRPRRLDRALRVELPEAAAAHQARQNHPQQSRDVRSGARDLLGAFFAATTVATGVDPRVSGTGATGGRSGPCRGGIRSIHARGLLGLAGDDPGDRHHQGDASAARHPDLEPHAGAVGRAPAALPLPLDRLPDAGQGATDHRAQGAGHQPAPRPRDREVHGDAPAGAAGQGARRRRDARLGPGARLAARRPHRRHARGRDARLRAEGRRRHEALPRRGGEDGARHVPARRRELGVRRDLAAAVARFATLLRRSGLPVTLVEVTDAVRALDHLDLGDRHELYLGLRAIFVTRPEEVPPFDRCFDAFWRIEPDGDDSSGFIPAPAIEDPTGANLVKSDQKKEALALDSWGEEEAEEAGDPLSVPLASEAEALVHQDFATFGADQLDDLLKLTVKIARRLAHRMSRRRRPRKRRGRVDLRRTLRANLTKGDLIDLRFRERKRKKVRLVLLCDVSGSMDLYSRFLLQFLFAL